MIVHSTGWVVQKVDVLRGLEVASIVKCDLRMLRKLEGDVTQKPTPSPSRGSGESHSAVESEALRPQSLCEWAAGQHR
jgi:hypothetical protein